MYELYFLKQSEIVLLVIVSTDKQYHPHLSSVLYSCNNALNVIRNLLQWEVNFVLLLNILNCNLLIRKTAPQVLFSHSKLKVT